MNPPPAKADCEHERALAIVPPPPPSQNVEPPTPESLPQEFFSSRCSASSDSISSSSKRQRNRPRRRPTPAYELACSPQDPFLLHTERVYLHQALLRQAAWSEKLYRDHCLADEAFTTASNAKEQRRWKKKRSLLREKINESACQERVIYQRLGDLSFALSSQGRWMNAQRAIMLTPPLAAQPHSPTNCKQHRALSTLNAASPTFVPGSLSLGSGLDTKKGIGTVSEEDEVHDGVVKDQLDDVNARVALHGRRRLSLNSPAASPFEKRLSLPNT